MRRTQRRPAPLRRELPDTRSRSGQCSGPRVGVAKGLRWRRVSRTVYPPRMRRDGEAKADIEVLANGASEPISRRQVAMHIRIRDRSSDQPAFGLPPYCERILTRVYVPTGLAKNSGSTKDKTPARTLMAPTRSKKHGPSIPQEFCGMIQMTQLARHNHTQQLYSILRL